MQEPLQFAGRHGLKILILKPSSLGDVIQALPVLRNIKRQLPDSRIYWWIETRLAGLLEGDPDLEGIVLFDRKGWSKPRRWRQLWRDICWMRAQKFDWVIDLQSLARSGSLAWLANGSLTIGLDDIREGARGFYDIAVPRAGYAQHAVDWYLATLPKLGIGTAPCPWMPPRPAAARGIRSKWPVEQHRWVVIQPGARWDNKRWPADYYARVVRLLAATDSDLRFAILGSADDKPQAEKISAAAPGQTLDLTGQLNLGEMVEWIRAAALMISNDTGPMHVAAAIGTPLIAIFGPTDPRRTGPYGQLPHVVRSHADCAPCMSDSCHRTDQPMECLTSILPERIASTARARLNAALPA